MKFNDKVEERSWTNVNHYYAEKFFLYLGKDRHYKAYNGEIAYFNYVSGEGALKTKPDFKDKNDVFGFDTGFEALKGDDD